MPRKIYLQQIIFEHCGSHEDFFSIDKCGLGSHQSPIEGKLHKKRIL